MSTNRKIDHLVYAVNDLEEAMAEIEEKTGVRPRIGGRHLDRGTKNALMNLGSGCYLELIAVDQENNEVSAPRWMGVDLITQPQLTRWALKSDDLSADCHVLKKYNAEMGNIQSGQRTLANGKLLSWEMVLPLAAPAVESIPFIVNWQQSAAHPTDTMPDECELIGMEFKHPEPAKLVAIFAELGIDFEVTFGAQININAEIKTPKGIIRI